MYVSRPNCSFTFTLRENRAFELDASLLRREEGVQEFILASPWNRKNVLVPEFLDKQQDLQAEIDLYVFQFSWVQTVGCGGRVN